MSTYLKSANLVLKNFRQTSILDNYIWQHQNVKPFWNVISQLCFSSVRHLPFAILFDFCYGSWILGWSIEQSHGLISNGVQLGVQWSFRFIIINFRRQPFSTPNFIFVCRINKYSLLFSNLCSSIFWKVSYFFLLVGMERRVRWNFDGIRRQPILSLSASSSFSFLDSKRRKLNSRYLPLILLAISYSTTRFNSTNAFPAWVLLIECFRSRKFWEEDPQSFILLHL